MGNACTSMIIHIDELEGSNLNDYENAPNLYEIVSAYALIFMLIRIIVGDFQVINRFSLDVRR